MARERSGTPALEGRAAHWQNLYSGSNRCENTNRSDCKVFTPPLQRNYPSATPCTLTSSTATCSRWRTIGASRVTCLRRRRRRRKAATRVALVAIASRPMMKLEKTQLQQRMMPVSRTPTWRIYLRIWNPCPPATFCRARSVDFSLGPEVCAGDRPNCWRARRTEKVNEFMTFCFSSTKYLRNLRW